MDLLSLLIENKEFVLILTRPNLMRKGEEKENKNDLVFPNFTLAESSGNIAQLQLYPPFQKSSFKNILLWIDTFQKPLLCLHLKKGAFNNYADKIFDFFDHPSTPHRQTNKIKRVHLLYRRKHFTYHLPIRSYLST